jgi:hypothetical protein
MERSSGGSTRSASLRPTHSPSEPKGRVARMETPTFPERAHEARRVVVLTGAGVSAESGVPTFRGADGLWRRHRAEDLATPEAFARDARLVWEWYEWRHVLRFLLITQNVVASTGVRAAGVWWATGICGASVVSPGIVAENEVPLPSLLPYRACGGSHRTRWFGEYSRRIRQAYRPWSPATSCWWGVHRPRQPAASLPMTPRRTGPTW